MKRSGYGIAVAVLIVMPVRCAEDTPPQPAGRDAWKEPQPAERPAPADASGVPEWHASFKKTFRNPKEAMDAMGVREPSAPKAGTPAPDFELTDPSGEKTVRLSSFKGKAPVVLIFGSYT